MAQPGFEIAGAGDANGAQLHKLLEAMVMGDMDAATGALRNRDCTLLGQLVLGRGRLLHVPLGAITSGYGNGFTVHSPSAP